VKKTATLPATGSRRGISVLRLQLSACVLVLFSSGHVLSQETSGSERVPDFGRDLLPILTNKCLQCHGGVHRKNELDLRTHASLLKGGKTGPAVKPGDVKASLIWEKVSTDKMPKTDLKLTAEERAILQGWIAAGARPPASADTPPHHEQSVPRKPAEVAAAIDRGIEEQLKRAMIPPSPIAADSEFLRRVYLDIIGRIPRLDEARQFLESKEPDKRSRLIDDLLSRPDYGRHFAEIWINIFNVFRVNDKREPNAAGFRDWMGNKLNDGVGWGEIVHEMLAVNVPSFKEKGNNKVIPVEAQYFVYTAQNMGQLDPVTTTSVTAQVFMGIGLHCAECHDHPFQDFEQTDYWGMAAFFGGLGGNGVPNTTGLSDEPIVIKSGKPPTMVTLNIYSEEARHRNTRVQARFPGGPPPTLDPLKDRRRAAFADWLLAPENPYFARTYVNRIWGQFFGHGFVADFADFNKTSPPTHPGILRLLASEAIASKFDQRHLIRCICNSQTYQRTGKPLPGNKNDGKLFSHMTGKVLSPEALYDSLCTVLEVPEIPVPKPETGKGKKAPPTQPDPREQFAKFFRGMSAVQDPTEFVTGVPQSLRVLNQPVFNKGGALVERLMKLDARPEAMIENLFIAAYARLPLAEERADFVAFARSHPEPREMYNRLLWALVNSSEFSLNH